MVFCMRFGSWAISYQCRESLGKVDQPTKIDQPNRIERRKPGTLLYHPCPERKPAEPQLISQIFGVWGSKVGDTSSGGPEVDPVRPARRSDS